MLQRIAKDPIYLTKGLPPEGVDPQCLARLMEQRWIRRVGEGTDRDRLALTAAGRRVLSRL